MKKLILILSIITLSFCGGGEQNTSNMDDIHEHQSGEKAHEREKLAHSTQEHEQIEGLFHEDITIPLPKQKEWGIVVGPPISQNISSQVALPGSLTLNTNTTAHISSFVHGQISHLAADLGNKVNKGQALLTINSTDFGKAQADFLETRARLNLSQQEYERAKMLLQEKAIEEKEYLRRKAEYERLSAAYGALGSALHSYGITHEHIDALIAKVDSLEGKEYKCEIADPNLPIRSPLAGTVIFRDAILGEHIEPGKVLFTVSNLNTLWALLDAYERDLPYIAQQSRVHIVTPLYPGKKFPGTITHISDLIDEKLRTVKVRVEVQNAEGLLKPNMYIQGLVENRVEGQDLLAVPQEAIQNMGGQKIVFVMEKENTFSARPVDLGNKIGNHRIITEGLKPEDRLVLEGAFTIKTELTKGTFGHKHMH